MAEKEPVEGGSPSEPYSASDFRDSNAQRQYREQSQSKDKDTKEVAHKLPLDTTATVLNDYRGPGRPSGSEASDVKKVVNDPDNLRMVNTDTNRSDHTKLDNSIKEKAETHEPLTAKEEQRALQGATVVLKHEDELKPGTAQCFGNFYGNLETQSGETVWKKAQDKQDKK